MHRGRKNKLQNLAQRKGSSSNNIKHGFLQDHSSKIEQKLNHLKEQILQKRKLSLNDKKNTPNNSDLVSFMNKIGMLDYMHRFSQNGIDSLQILKEIKQSELEQIGVAKGHALKIIVNLRKEEQRTRKKTINEQKSYIQSTLDQSSKKQIKKLSPDIYQMQTQSIPLQKVKKQFCLYCFSRSQHTFCSSNCQNLYNSMFQRYENNLQKAEETFMPKRQQKEQELSDNQQFIEDFDFLFNPKLQDFDEHQYQKIKQIIKK